MEVDSMACKCGGTYTVKDNKFVCANCGRLAPYQPGKSYDQLINENAELLEENEALKAEIEKLKAEMEY